MRPLALDRLCALVEPAAAEARQGDGAVGTVYRRLSEQLQPLADNPIGVGLGRAAVAAEAPRRGGPRPGCGRDASAAGRAGPAHIRRAAAATGRLGGAAHRTGLNRAGGAGKAPDPVIIGALRRSARLDASSDSHRASACLASVALLGHRQESPAQRLVLRVVLAQRQCRHRLRHLVAQVERVRRVELASRARISSNSSNGSVPRRYIEPLMTWISPRLGEEAVVAVRDSRGQFAQRLPRRARAASGRAAGPGPAPACFGSTRSRHGVIDQPPRQVKLADADCGTS